MKYGLLIAGFLAQGCLAQPADSVFRAEGVVAQWQTDPVLATPESVTYDKNSEVLYVSNINGGLQEKNGKGYISKVSLNGEVIEAKWATDLHAPKGMALSGDQLYVTDIDAVKAVSLESGQQVASIPVPGAQFLNDLAVTRSGVLYATGMYTDRIYKIQGDTAEVFTRSSELDRPNGIYALGDDLYVGNQNQLLHFKLGQQEPDGYEGGTGPIDGLHPLADERFLTSDWKGRLFIQDYEESGHQRKRLLDMRNTDHKVADMTFIPEKSLVLIPTFSTNQVAAYTIPVGSE
jgi:sugar lactone lactonase YvrE